MQERGETRAQMATEEERGGEKGRCIAYEEQASSFLFVSWCQLIAGDILPIFVEAHMFQQFILCNIYQSFIRSGYFES